MEREEAEMAMIEAIATMPWETMIMAVLMVAALVCAVCLGWIWWVRRSTRG